MDWIKRGGGGGKGGRKGGRDSYDYHRARLLSIYYLL